ncbi:MAG TPA: GAF domain-containing protein [Syntrophales bacterium]|nr:GAF domain-containing protein [Syntrophales bacterium]HOM06283.1 GAF domain-containing protein [Syntrophales bacterium]HON99278.1 GAF domain-containing protein [Syntrophales bacterium]HPC00103.1 GAF domain-containing protein [Syntrophales bacterium]HPQ05736.1 GAF domain-containing protein [Syntrophales bacterium]
MRNGGEDHFNALYELARVVNASLETGVVLEKVVTCVTKAMGVKAASIRLLDARGKRLVLAASCGLSEGYLHKGPVSVHESGLDRKALAGQTVYVEDAPENRDFQYGERARAEGIRSVLVTPLIVEEAAIGVLRIYTDEVRAFSDREIRFLEAAANLSAIAIANARLHEMIKTKCELMAQHKYRIDDN